MNKYESTIKSATEKAIQLVNEGSSEVWSSQLGDLTKKQMIAVVLNLNNTGLTVRCIVNSLDNGFVVVKR